MKYENKPTHYRPYNPNKDIIPDFTGKVFYARGSTMIPGDDQVLFVKGVAKDGLLCVNPHIAKHELKPQLITWQHLFDYWFDLDRCSPVGAEEECNERAWCYNAFCSSASFRRCTATMGHPIEHETDSL